MTERAGDEPDAEFAAARLAANTVVIFAVDGDDLFVADAAPADPRPAESLRIPVGFGVTGQVARDARAVRLDEDSPRNLVHRRLIGLAAGERVSRLCVPIPGLYGEIVGVLAAYRRPPRPFSAADQIEAGDLAAPLGLRMHTEQLWRAVRRHRAERDRLIRAAIRAQEDERRRIAFDLHDGVTTVLAAMGFHLNAAALAVRRIGDADEAVAQIAAAQRLTDVAYQQTRAAISGLHSLVLADLGLVSALESLVQTIAAGAGASVELLTDPAAEFAVLPPHVGSALYRIAQEALGNAVRHARAQRVVLSLRRVEAGVALGCSDDGVGFDPEHWRRGSRGPSQDREHFGLASIEQRCALLGADLRVESAPGRGARVIVELAIPTAFSRRDDSAPSDAGSSG